VRKRPWLATLDEPLRRLVAAWLPSFKSNHTWVSYSGDLGGWLEFCADHQLDPLTVRRAHVDAWA